MRGPPPCDPHEPELGGHSLRWVLCLCVQAPPSPGTFHRSVLGTVPTRPTVLCLHRGLFS